MSRSWSSMLGAVIVPPAQAKAPPPSSYSPQTGALFNDPERDTSDRAAGPAEPRSPTQSTASPNQLDHSDSQPIRSVTSPWPTRLIAAHEREASKCACSSTAITTNYSRPDRYPQLKALRSALGTDRSKTQLPPNLHVQLHVEQAPRTCTPSSTCSREPVDATHVSMISSANPAWTGVTTSWNNTLHNRQQQDHL